MNINKILLERILFENSELVENIDYEDIFSTANEVYNIVLGWEKYIHDDEKPDDFSRLATDNTIESSGNFNSFIRQSINSVNTMKRKLSQVYKKDIIAYRTNKQNTRARFDFALLLVFNCVEEIFRYNRIELSTMSSSPKSIKLGQLLIKDLYFAIKPFLEIVKQHEVDYMVLRGIDNIYVIFRNIINAPVSNARRNKESTQRLQKERAGDIINHVTVYLNRLIDLNRDNRQERNENLISNLRKLIESINTTTRLRYYNAGNLELDVSNFLRLISDIPVSKSFIKTLIELTRKTTNNLEFGTEYVR